MISIANLAKLFKTSLRTIRYYEEKGLIEESVRIKGQRYYNEKSVIARLQEIFFFEIIKFKIRRYQVSN
ncbi:MerR family transcriptional regulator [Enterococcus faecalis]|uniref:MerR family transcriptional regulator n=1 Tax=Enterococcus faecalis TaxID=1351 RepID=UPI00338D5545